MKTCEIPEITVYVQHSNISLKLQHCTTEQSTDVCFEESMNIANKLFLRNRSLKIIRNSMNNDCTFEYPYQQD